jgi:hypothetical protein
MGWHHPMMAATPAQLSPHGISSNCDPHGEDEELFTMISS